MSGHRRGETPPGAEPPPAEYEFVDDTAGIQSVAEALRSSTGAVAVDVERASGIRYSERAFLLQLRPSNGPALLVDPETPGRTVGPLAGVLSERPLLLHAATQDMPSLRELGIAPASIIDTELAGRFLGTERVNLGAMISEHLGIGLAKAHSAADWSRRPLPGSWLDYAAYDVLFLHELAEAVLPLLDELGLEPGLLLKPASLRLWVWRAATSRPSDDAALMDTVLRGEDARDWQIDLTAGPLLTAVEKFREG